MFSSHNLGSVSSLFTSPGKEKRFKWQTGKFKNLFGVSPTHLTPGFVLACWTVPLQKALTRLCDTYCLTLCSSSKDWFQHTASLYDSRCHIPFSYPVNLYSSCLCMLASGASLIGVFYRLAEGCCSGICWYRFFWNLFRAWLVKGSRLLQLICQIIKYRKSELPSKYALSIFWCDKLPSSKSVLRIHSPDFWLSLCTCRVY